jgi:molybdate transport system regulatory protein
LKRFPFCGCGIQTLVLKKPMGQESPFHIRSKIWIEDQSGDVVFGLGRLKILDAIDRLGSIQGAAKELKMSYRAIWGRIKATEERLNRPLLIRNIGGRSGGGSQLTPFALSLLVYFRHLHQRISDLSDSEFEKSMAPHFEPD